MITREFSIQFTTPAFLGNAEQNGQWRTPPFKHLLREWWRVAWAESHDFNISLGEMRSEEGRLFGVAADDGDSRKSRVRIRLARWDQGGMKEWARVDPKVFHKEVGNGGREVGSHLYLGYGPLTYDKGAKQTKLKVNAAIQAGEENAFKLAYPKTSDALLMRALELASWFGAIGGRSRNGWGSFMLLGEDLGDQPGYPLRDWRECLKEEWAHAIGCDETGPLVWWTEAHRDWSSLMKTLAELKIGLRTSFSFSTGKKASNPEPRHYLSYPVTNHSVNSWDRNARLPNSLRFKAWQGEDGNLYGLIYHMPCKPPEPFRARENTLISLWGKVHEYLDSQDNLERSAQ